MLFRWRYVITLGLILLFLISIVLSTNQQVISLEHSLIILNKKSFTVVPNKSIIFQKEYQAIYITQQADLYQIKWLNAIPEKMWFIKDGVHYDVYLLKNNIEPVFTIIYPDGNAVLANSEILPTANFASNYYINNANYFVRYDTTYVCNDELKTKHPQIMCHQKSYRLDFPLFV